MAQDAEIPEGVELLDPMDFTTRRKRIFDAAKDQLIQAFPQQHGGVELGLEDVDYEDPEEFDKDEQKTALLQDKFLARRLRGTMVLKDTTTGKELARQRQTLMRVPVLTDRGTFIHGGNEYTSVMQGRLVSGVFTRKKNNGVIEAHVNVRPGTGAQFRVLMEPDTAQYRLRVRDSNLHLYSLLKDLGIEDATLEKSWGPEILAANNQRYDARVLDKAYQHLVPRREQDPKADRTTKASAVRKAFDNAKVNGSVLRKTLPNYFDLQHSDQWVKQASAEPVTVDPETLAELHKKFTPDLTPEQLIAETNALYGGVGPQLASMKQWPDRWIHPDHEQGWLQWYSQYAEGARHEDDARQIKRWLGVRKRFSGIMERRLSPRMAFVLRNWAIDPLKIIKDPEDRAELERKMKEYRDQETQAYELSKQASAPQEFVHTLVAPPVLEGARPFIKVATCDGAEIGIDPGTETEPPALQMRLKGASIGLTAPLSVRPAVGSEDVDDDLLSKVALALSMELQGRVFADELSNGDPQSVLEALAEAASDEELSPFFPCGVKSAALFEPQPQEDDNDDPDEVEAQQDFQRALTGLAGVGAGVGLATAAGAALTPTESGQLHDFSQAMDYAKPPWSNGYDPQTTYSDYLSKGHEVMRVRPFGRPMTEMIQRSRETLGAVLPNHPWAWKKDFVDVAPALRNRLNLSDPAVQQYLERPGDPNTRINDSALHYMAFQQDPQTAYLQTWREYAPDKLDKLSKLLSKWNATQRQPRIDPNFFKDFDSWVRDKDPSFWHEKQQQEWSTARHLWDAGRVYGDAAKAGKFLVHDLPMGAAWVAGGVGAGLLGTGLYRLYKRFRLRRAQKQMLEDA